MLFIDTGTYYKNLFYECFYEIVYLSPDVGSPENTFIQSLRPRQDFLQDTIEIGPHFLLTNLLFLVCFTLRIRLYEKLTEKFISNVIRFIFVGGLRRRNLTLLTETRLS